VADVQTIGEELIEIEEGYLEDYLTGDPIKDNPEERVRQIYLKRLNEEYNYPKRHIEKEFMIQKGSKKIGPADIVIFHSDAHSLDNIHTIVEVKKEDREDGLDQLKSYLSPTKADFGVWFNGREIEHIKQTKETPYFRSIPDIPKYGEKLEDIGLYLKKDLEPASELKSVFETIHNYIYANEGFLKDKVFNEILKLIFIKMVDEKAGKPKCQFRITDDEKQKVEKGIESGFKSRIKDLFKRVKDEYSDVFEGNEKINLTADSLAFAVSRLQRFSLTNTPSEVKGTAFQTFIGPMQRGERGEFFTPQPILELCVEMLNPQDGEFLLDPACGSGGFLIESMKHVWGLFKQNRLDASESDLRDMIVRFAHNYIRGIDFNPDLAKVAKMYMVLYDDGHTGIFSTNSLESFEKIENAAKEAGANSNVEKDSFDVILTNPPFGTKGKITNQRILRQFELGYKWKKNKNTEEYKKTSNLQKGQTPEILFIERCLQFTKNGGRMAIVLPDGILTNSTTQYVRDFIKNRARIIGVVSLPDGTFRQAGVNPKASVLFLQKLPEEELNDIKKEDYEIFMAKAEEIGYELDKKTAKTKFQRNEEGEVIKDEDGEPIINTDVPKIVNEFREFQVNNNLRFE